MNLFSSISRQINQPLEKQQFLHRARQGVFQPCRVEPLHAVRANGTHLRYEGCASFNGLQDTPDPIIIGNKQITVDDPKNFNTAHTGKFSKSVASRHYQELPPT